MPTFEFKVEMTCTGCSGALERVLGKAKEKGDINSFAVDLNAQSVIVETAKTRAEAEEIVKKAGKETVFVAERA